MEKVLRQGRLDLHQMNEEKNPALSETQLKSYVRVCDVV